MTPERYHELEKCEGVLTKEEIAEGWHFCPEWDYRLIGPESPEDTEAREGPRCLCHANKPCESCEE